MGNARIIVACSLIVSFVFAGCVGGEAEDGTANQETDSTVDAGAGGDTAVAGPIGSIEGAVRDDELKPLAKANVALLKTDFKLETNAEGTFAFVNLPAGEYTIIAQKLGYESRAQKIVVNDGQTTWTNLTLNAIAAAGETFTDTTSHTATLDCMLVTGAWVSTCSWPYTAVYLTALNNGVNLSQYGAPADIFDNKWRYNYTIQPGAKTVVSELTWKAQSEMAKKMFINQCRPDYDPVEDYCPKSYARSPGQENPITVHWDPKPVYAEKKFNNWVMSAVWPAFPGLTSTNQGVYLEQKIEMWNTEFYGEEAPENWSILVPPS